MKKAESYESKELKSRFIGAFLFYVLSFITTIRLLLRRTLVLQEFYSAFHNYVPFIVETRHAMSLQ